MMPMTHPLQNEWKHYLNKQRIDMLYNMPNEFNDFISKINPIHIEISKVGYTLFAEVEKCLYKIHITLNSYNDHLRFYRGESYVLNNELFVLNEEEENIAISFFRSFVFLENSYEKRTNFHSLLHHNPQNLAVLKNKKIIDSISQDGYIRLFLDDGKTVFIDCDQIYIT